MAHPWTLLAAILLGAVTSTAARSDPTCGPPAWASLPTADDLAAVYPAKALTDEKAGRAVLRCTTRPDGAIAACAIESEDPPEYGFGAAAMKLAGKIRATPPCPGSPETKPGGARLPIRFVLPRQPPPREFVFADREGRFRSLAPLGPYWPERALRMGIGAVLVMDCVVDEADRVSNCQTVQETPPDQDFGNAVRKMMSRGLVSAGPEPSGTSPPEDHIWRFSLVFPAHKL